MKYLTKILIFVFCFFCLHTFGQVEDLNFKNHNSKTGLSNDWVNSIAEDDRGFIWVGSRSGLNIYDGNSCLIYRHHQEDSASISHDNVSEILFSLTGDMVVATWGRELNLVNPYSQKITRRKTPINEDIFFVKAMTQSKDSILWIATYGQGLYKYNISKDEYTKCTFDNQIEKGKYDLNYLEDIVVLEDTIWVVTRDGVLCHINIKESTIFQAKDSEGKGIDLSDLGHLNTVDGELVIGDRYGNIYTYDRKQKKILTFIEINKDKTEQCSINYIIKDEMNNLWISTSKGIYRSNLESKITTLIISSVAGVDYSNIFCSYFDSRGILWFGSWGSGLYSHYDASHNFKEISLENFNSAFVYSIHPYSDSLLLFGTTEGLIAFNKKTRKSSRLNLTGSVKQKHEISHNYISAITTYKDKLFLGVYGKEKGFHLVDKDFNVLPFKTGANYDFKNGSIVNADKLKNGDLWIGTWASGAILMRPEKDEYFYFTQNNSSLNSPGISSVFLSSSNTIWVGAQNGLSRFSPDKNEFISEEIVFKNHNISLVKDIQEDQDGNLWVACSEGLLKYNLLTKEKKLFTKSDGLADKLIYSLVLVDHTLWATSNLGLIKIDVNNYEVDNFTIGDGLEFNSFNERGAYFSKEESLLYLASGERIVYFDPEDISSTKTKVKFYFKEFLLDDKIVTYEDQIIGDHISKLKDIELSHYNNNISFNVSIQDFNSYRSKKFAHRLKGFNEKWLQQNVHNGIVRYTNLDPGRYVLQLAEVDHHGNILSEVKELKVRIKAPFWTETWFILLMIMVFILILLYLRRLRTKQVIERYKVLEKKIRERTQIITQKNNELKDERELMSSNVRYASLLQESLFPKKLELDEAFQENFIFNKPKDLVSGDFYWFTKVGNKSIFVVSDCTGHGVSGAFVSILGITALKTIVQHKEIEHPDLILRELHKEISKSFNNGSEMRDGMDISIMTYDHEKKTLELSAAMSSPILISEKGEVTVIKGDRFPIGGDSEVYKNKTNYKRHTIPVTEPLTIYLFTDGFEDQFGGLDNKKFMKRKFREFLLEIHSQEMPIQKKKLLNTFNAWKGNHVQIDDVLVAGIKIKP